MQIHRPASLSSVVGLSHVSADFVGLRVDIVLGWAAVVAMGGEQVQLWNHNGVCH